MAVLAYEVLHQKLHSVYFLDGSGRLIGEPLRVRHGESVTPPACQPPPGHIFLNWSRSTSRVTEDIYCVALTSAVQKRQKARIAFHCVTYYDGVGQVLDMRMVSAGEAAPLPDFAPAQGRRLLGWDVKFNEGGDMFVPAGKPLPRVTCDCRVYARCEAAACRLFAVDLRETVPKLMPLGSFGYGALISQEDLACLHLRSMRYLYPFRFTIRRDTVLALTQQGVRSFDMDMQPLKMNAVRLMSDADRSGGAQFECAPRKATQDTQPARAQLMRKGA